MNRKLLEFEYNLNAHKRAMVMGDIVNFKLINIYYGTEKKNYILKQVLQIIKDNIDGQAIQLYEDQFLILLYYDNKSDITDTLTRINKEVEKVLDDDMFNLSLNFGISIVKDETFAVSENKAAIACKENKNHIDSFYSFYDSIDLEKKIKDRAILDNLVKALKNKNFVVYYQPKYNTNNKKIEGSEALIKLIDNDKIISAGEFIDIAENSGFTALLDKYVFTEVCRKIKKLKEDNIKFNRISINISRESLNNKNIINNYIKVMNQYNVVKDDIEFEITERNTRNENEIVRATLKELCRKFNVSIDDFGVGSSSLAMLNDFNIKVIKIDRKFINDHTKTGKIVLDSIISLAKELKLKTIAEGVETEEEYLYLKEKGCDLIQGYYFSKALPFDEYKEKLESQV